LFSPIKPFLKNHSLTTAWIIQVFQVVAAAIAVETA
jgi:hypothetical protein